MEKGIIDIIGNIDWIEIKSFYHKLNITWEFPTDDGSEHRIPEISEVQRELVLLLNYMRERNIQQLTYGNWVIFWNSHDLKIGEIRVIFKLTDTYMSEKGIDSTIFPGVDVEKLDLDNLQELLDDAITAENFEKAAELRDKIRNFKKEHK